MEFVCADRQAVVRAANVRATLEAFSFAPSIGHRFIAKHKLRFDELTPERFVPIQGWLDALKEIQRTVGVSVVRAVGSRVVENAEFPPQFSTVESTLESLDDIYYRNHRGEVGHYRFERQCDSLIVRCETPYPHHFEWGLLEGICQRKAARGRRYVVSCEPGPVGSDLTCTLTVNVEATVRGKWR